MKSSQRLKYYLIGFTISVLLILMFNNPLKNGCSYFPNERVLAEIKTHPISLTDQSKDILFNQNIEINYFLDSILYKGKINFKESNAQNLPCPNYILYFNNYKIYFTKCKDSTKITNIEF